MRRAGRDREVNFVAGAIVAALSNILNGVQELGEGLGGAASCQFGGDGAMAAVPPQCRAAVAEVLAALAHWSTVELDVPLRVAVMGCVVNGPGEAREADLGVASGNGKGQIFVKGEVIKTVPESMIVETLIEEAMRIADELRGADTSAGGSPVVTVS